MWQATWLLFVYVVYDSKTAMAVQRSILFDLKDEIVPPTNETVTQVFARLSAYRDSMDGPQVSCNHMSPYVTCRLLLHCLLLLAMCNS